MLITHITRPFTEKFFKNSAFKQIHRAYTVYRKDLFASNVFLDGISYFNWRREFEYLSTKGLGVDVLGVNDV